MVKDTVIEIRSIVARLENVEADVLFDSDACSELEGEAAHLYVIATQHLQQAIAFFKLAKLKEN